VVFIAAIIIFFKIPYSKTMNRFRKDVQKHSEQSNLQSVVFSDQNIAFLPEPVQKHFRAAGYIGKPKMASISAYMQSIPLRSSIHKPPMIIDYTLHLFAYKPVRLAYIKTSVFGIPFEGYDSTQNGIGFMKGVIGKVITLFNQTGAEMDKAQLLTYLGECFLFPSAVLSKYIAWEPIDATHVKAVITYKGVSGSGVFAFSSDGLLKSFYTDERAQIQTGGKINYPGWSAVFEDYRQEDGIWLPKNIKAVWHEEDGDLVYFNENNLKIKFHILDGG